MALQTHGARLVVVVLGRTEAGSPRFGSFCAGLARQTIGGCAARASQTAVVAGQAGHRRPVVVKLLHAVAGVAEVNAVRVQGAGHAGRRTVLAGQTFVVAGQTG